MFKKSIADRIEGVFPPAPTVGFDVGNSIVRHQAIGALDQKYLLAHATHTNADTAPAARAYTRIPPLRVLDQLDPRLSSPAAQNVIQRARLAVADLVARPTRAGTLGIPTGLLLLFMLLLGQTLSELPHHTPRNQPQHHRPQPSTSIQISPTSSQVNSGQGTGNKSSGSGSTASATQASSSAGSAIQTASSTTPTGANAAPVPNGTVVGGRGGGPISAPEQPAVPSSPLLDIVNQTVPTTTVTVPPVSIPSQGKPIIDTSGTHLILN